MQIKKCKRYTLYSQRKRDDHYSKLFDCPVALSSALKEISNSFDFKKKKLTTHDRQIDGLPQEYMVGGGGGVFKCCSNR
eukprot:scaffold1000_cov134-Skeletonema_menzelii.AAC.3